MSTNISKYKEALNSLYKKGIQLQLGMLEELNKLDKEIQKEALKKLTPISFRTNYEEWYSEALVLIKQLLPDRLSDFNILYKNDKRKATDYQNYTISDYLIGLTVTRGLSGTVVDSSAGYPKFQQQLLILGSALKRFDSLLFDIKQLLQADLFDTELDVARELLKKGFLRASGAIAGVLIEKHLKEVVQQRKLTLKKNSSIADLNEVLKNNNIIDIPQWRHIQLMADIRNLCDHHKGREPNKEEIEDLLNGTNKILKTIY